MEAKNKCLDCSSDLPKPKTNPRLYCDKCRRERLLLSKRQSNAKWWNNTDQKEFNKKRRIVYQTVKNTPELKSARNEKLRQQRKEIRLEIIKQYGNKCDCCQETNIEFLAIDHINGGGGIQRKEMKNHLNFYRWIIKNNFPDILRVLCHNCNMAFGFFGYCPHQK
jgi:hypothetical protein